MGNGLGNVSFLEKKKGEMQRDEEMSCQLQKKRRDTYMHANGEPKHRIESDHNNAFIFSSLRKMIAQSDKAAP